MFLPVLAAILGIFAFLPFNYLWIFGLIFLTPLFIFLIKEEKDGNYHCTYSWGFFQATMKPIVPGSSSGIISFENDNTIIFKKPNYTITLIKKDENTLKGRWERIGPTGTGWTAHFEGYFKRVK